MCSSDLAKLSTEVLVLARTAYDLLGLPLPTLDIVFPDVTFDTQKDDETAIQPRTNGVVPIIPMESALKKGIDTKTPTAEGTNETKKTAE